jgi:hypothetical protein
VIGVRWMWAQVDQQCVIKANAQFWEQMLAMTLDPTLASEEFCVQAGHIVGSVSLSGEWKGLIEVRMAGGLDANRRLAGGWVSPRIRGFGGARVGV